jgi:hypothetical protein
MPECPGMTDEEAAVVLKWWCRQNNNPYNDDMNNIDGIINVKMRAIITRR